MYVRWEKLRTAYGPVQQLHPPGAKGWRCRVWEAPCGFEWEARRFGRSPLHVSGECEKQHHAKAVAIAAVYAIKECRR